MLDKGVVEGRDLVFHEVVIGRGGGGEFLFEIGGELVGGVGGLVALLVGPPDRAPTDKPDQDNADDKEGNELRSRHRRDTPERNLDAGV